MSKYKKRQTADKKTNEASYIDILNTGSSVFLHANAAFKYVCSDLLCDIFCVTKISTDWKIQLSPENTCYHHELLPGVCKEASLFVLY